MISRVELARGFAVPSHHHANEQFAVVLSGRVRFGLGVEGSSAHRYEVADGGSIVVLPANVQHAAEALEDSVILDIFSPPSATTGVDASVRG